MERKGAGANIPQQPRRRRAVGSGYLRVIENAPLAGPK
ncbi:hypothetical protein FTUN_2937 [Frigoriglobus tundricola]|uniref:Uncharacterized protein n=1 Tax=Frigoriglobus tundricola TaxID=2774151 RepID=A0A6M5YN95_9BACT|nr:hypothetical protein FTUN_2937 [Frigoriglobus tundricola]